MKTLRLADGGKRLRNFFARSLSEPPTRLRVGRSALLISILPIRRFLYAIFDTWPKV